MGSRKCITPSPSGVAFEEPSPFPSLGMKWDTVTPSTPGEIYCMMEFAGRYQGRGGSDLALPFSLQTFGCRNREVSASLKDPGGVKGI